uniref:Methyltransferase domain-containing protein n=1 Tax=Tetraselmis chuii TaxID=63592 RepID=A0A7S1X159_9CHLO|mmetsp:Transcript_1861/g.3262  ORF Transcript_1861/g.3262 Transcript_1861/m.3262 type:complete len:366 (+) Transcript_1861:103-1200(+)
MPMGVNRLAKTASLGRFATFATVGTALVLAAICLTLRSLSAEVARLVKLQASPISLPQTSRLAEVESSLPKVMVGGDAQNLRELTLEERLRYLELKVNAALSWGQDPYYGFRVTTNCANASALDEYGCKEGKGGCPGLYDHRICLDGWSHPPDGRSCLIYDFGIRQQPEFGYVMATVFGCEVHGFDPSPITNSQWIRTSGLLELPNYHFHSYGVGGVDGEMTLANYDWDQVSIVRSMIHEEQLTSFPVKTLPTIMKELGHTTRNITIMKLDVEGSEYLFLEHAFDNLGCLPVDQLTIEWHHFAYDPRYGGGASPQVNPIVSKLSSCGLHQFWRHLNTGWLSQDIARFEKDGLHDIRYNLGSFKRV